ncbi:MAG: hypothetical protein ACI4Q6_05450 [Huintestinicola sp.]
MSENVKNNQVNDEQLEGVCGGNAPTMAVRSMGTMGSMKPFSTPQSKLINKAMEQSQNNSSLLTGDNIQPASGRIRDTEISDIMTAAEMEQADEETLKKALRI